MIKLAIVFLPIVFAIIWMLFIGLNINKLNKKTENLHEEYKKMFKNHKLPYKYLMDFLNELWHNQPNTVIGVGLAILVMLGIYIKLLEIYK